MSIQERFSPEDLERIKKAVRDAESKISGEIVPVFVERSGVYSIANYRAALIGAASVFLLIIIFDRYVPSLAVYDPVLIFSLVMLGGFIGALKSHFINPVKRFMLSKAHLDQARPSMRGHTTTTFSNCELYSDLRSVPSAVG